MTRARALLGGIALVLPVSVAGLARADGATDTKDQITAAVGEMDAAIKAKDENAGGAAAKKISGLYKGTSDAGARGAALKALASGVKQAKLATLRKAALDAMGETDDAPTAWTNGLSSVYPK